MLTLASPKKLSPHITPRKKFDGMCRDTTDRTRTLGFWTVFCFLVLQKGLGQRNVIWRRLGDSQNTKLKTLLQPIITILYKNIFCKINYVFLQTRSGIFSFLFSTCWNESSCTFDFHRVIG